MNEYWNTSEKKLHEKLARETAKFITQNFIKQPLNPTPMLKKDLEASYRGVKEDRKRLEERLLDMNRNFDEEVKKRVEIKDNQLRSLAGELKRVWHMLRLSMGEKPEMHRDKGGYVSHDPLNDPFINI